MTSAEKTQISKKELKQKITLEQYDVCVNKGTEMAFTGKYHDYKKPLIYNCVVCENNLFSSEAKFDSGNGWLRFYAPLKEENIKEDIDNSYFIKC